VDTLRERFFLWMKWITSLLLYPDLHMISIPAVLISERICAPFPHLHTPYYYGGYFYLYFLSRNKKEEIK